MPIEEGELDDILFVETDEETIVFGETATAPMPQPITAPVASAVATATRITEVLKGVERKNETGVALDHDPYKNMLALANQTLNELVLSSLPGSKRHARASDGLHATYAEDSNILLMACALAMYSAHNEEWDYIYLPPSLLTPAEIRALTSVKEKLTQFLQPPKKKASVTKQLYEYLQNRS